ncbi:hypothetical protein ALC53_05739, partial [Atta colombica]
KRKEWPTVERNWYAWNDPLATAATKPCVTMPRLEGLTPPTVGHGNLCCDNRTHGSPPAHAIAHTYVHPRVQQIQITRNANSYLLISRACEAAGWPILFYELTIFDDSVARHTSVFTDCRFMNKVDAQASAQAVCGFTISQPFIYLRVD